MATLASSLFLLIFLSGEVAPWDEDPNAPLKVSQQLALAPLVLASLWVTIRVFRQGVLARPDRLVVRNVLRTFEMPWNEIRAIDPPSRGGAVRNAGIQIRLTDGRTRSANLFTPGLFNGPHFADDVVGRLRELHARYSANPPHA